MHHRLEWSSPLRNHQLDSAACKKLQAGEWVVNGFSARQHHRTTRSSVRHSGVVLLLVVVLLAICCLILTQLSMVSFGAINQSKLRQRDLQRHWSIVSVRRAVLSQAEQVWTEQRDGEQTQVELDFELGGDRLQVRIENESTKLNVNRILKDLPPQASREILTEHLRPLDPGAFRTLSLLGTELHSWAELTEVRGIELLEATDTVTLWGDGKVNLWESEPEIIETVWKGQFGRFAPDELLEAREQFPQPTWESLKLRLRLSESDLKKAERWFTTKNTCFSLEVNYNSDQGQQASYLFIRNTGGNYGFRL